ncbi:MAG: PAS domain S-box protein, partial [Mycobacterium sp.]|nr:PAS domain S-box protein [Mycobacterium sp.]
GGPRRAVVLMRVWADALPDPVVLLEAVRDEQGSIIDFICRDANRAACEQAGMTRRQVVGSSLRDRIPNFGSQGMLERYADCVGTGEPLVINDLAYRHFEFEAEQRFDLRATSAGAELIAVTWRDVTARFEAEQLDKRYRQLMDHSAVPAALATPAGRLVSVNQAMATLLGYDIDTMLTMTWQELTAPQTIAEETKVVGDIIAGRRDTYRAIKQYVHADGHLVRADLSLSCIRRPDGEVEHFIAQIIDVAGYTDTP